MTEEYFIALVRKHNGRVVSTGRPVFDHPDDEDRFRTELTKRLRDEKPYLDQSSGEIG